MKKLTINDYNIIQPFLDDANYYGYNSNFVNIMMWDHEYNAYYEINDNYLIVLHLFGNERIFSMPFCKQDYIIDAIEYMLDYSKKHNFKFQIQMCTKDVKEIIEKQYNTKFLYLEDRDNFDYIYQRDVLASLSGKKMQKRRNHYNAFIKSNHNYIYKSIEDSDIDNVLKCLKHWDYESNNSDSIRSEYIAIMYLLIHRDELGIKTGCIYIDDKLEAFTIGSALKHNTIEIHIEKANKDIRGLYVAINKLFLEHNFTDYNLVNREEDMGLESLRKSKLALHPDHMIQKYRIIERNLKVVDATNKNLAEIKKMWINSFDDEDEVSTEYYFANIFDQSKCFLLYNDDMLIGSMQIKPCIIMLNSLECTNYFIQGVTINPLYQKNHCMKYMIEYILNLDDYKNKNIMLQAYNPKIYYSLGFKETYYQYVYRYDHDDNDDILFDVSEGYTSDCKLLEENYKEYTNNYDGYLIRDKDYYDNYYLPLSMSLKRSIRAIYNDLGDNIGYVQYEIKENHIYIYEFIINEQKYINKIINYYQTKYQAVTIYTNLVLDGYSEMKGICNMMCNYDVDDKDCLFINEIY